MLHHSHRSCRRPSPYRFPPYLASSHSSVTGSLPKDVRAETSAAPASGTSFVLVGATGSLAKKYLWQAVFELHLNMPKDNQLNVWAAARAAPEDGEPAVRQLLSTVLECPSRVPSDACEAVQAGFRSRVVYIQLKTEKDYEKLGTEISAVYAHGPAEAGRIIYLSVPPVAYAGAAAWINQHVRPEAPSTWLRVAIEKPFGSNLSTAKEMADAIAPSLAEDELYRVDHYIGKRGVQQIAAFRRHNAAVLGPLWHSGGVERVEIVMTETESCEGRTNFYDQYGIIRDIHQNHLTEILALVAMEVGAPGDDQATTEKQLKAKLAVLHALRTADVRRTLLGQYDGYRDHVRHDHKDDTLDSRTPTFAASVLSIDSPRWLKTPFVLVSGKELRERRAHVRVVLRSNKNTVCMGQPQCGQREIIFHIQGGGLEPSTLLHGAFPDITAPPGWRIEGNPAAGFLQIFPDDTVGSLTAYTSLVAQIFAGQRENFVSTDGLMTSWRVWTPLLDVIEHEKPNPRVYTRGGKEIHFRISDDKLEFSQEGAPSQAQAPQHMEL